MQDNRLLELVLPHAEDALNVLVDIMLDENADPAARVAAASAILDIGWGKPRVVVSGGELQAALASGEADEPTHH